MTTRPGFLSLSLALSLLLPLPSRAAAPLVTPAPPKLVLLVVFDQFRADYLSRFEKRYLPAAGAAGSVGGFRYLMSRGAYFPMAEYSILQSMTCPGHATVLTGALPYQMGIPANGWIDPATGEYVYCAEDPRHPTVGAAMNPHAGTSPKNLNGTTVGDELKNAGYPARVVTVALKDRSAIMMGGKRADLALWMDKASHRWVSSTYYLPGGKLPAWVEKLNAGIAAFEKGRTIRWEPQGEASGLTDPAYRPDADTSHIGQAFPHVLPADSKWGLAQPYGLELTEQAAERAFDEYGLGRGKATDILAVSFSSHDYVAHGFGPNSREAEEMAVAGDRQLARLLNHVRSKVPGGLRDVVILLTGDHGGPMDPDYARSKGIDAARFDEKAMADALEKRLASKFGAPAGGQKWIVAIRDLSVFVSHATVAARKAGLRDVLDEVKAHLLAVDGILHAFTRFDHAERKLPPGQHEAQILRTYYPGRSGDVMAIGKPYWMSEDGDTVNHMTGYSYDRMVPLILAGPRLKAGIHPQHVRVIDLAPTLSHLLSVTPPALSEGRVLHEAIR